MQRSFVTTEKHLIDILSSPPSDLKQRLLMKQDCVFISTESKDDQWDISNQLLLRFHQSNRVKLHCYTDFVDGIKSKPEWVTKLAAPIFYLDLSKEKASEISSDYGVCCMSVEDTELPFLLEKGWYHETYDVDREQSWRHFFDGVNNRINSAVIIDRYFFASEWDKKDGDLDDTIIDSFDNLKAIINSILPYSLKDNVFTLTIVFDKNAITAGRIRNHKEWNLNKV